MNLDTFEGTPPFLLNRHRVLFRIQPARARLAANHRRSVSGAASRPSRDAGIPDRRVAYFAELPRTRRGYEVSAAARAAVHLTERLRAGELLCAELADDMILLTRPAQRRHTRCCKSTRYPRRRRWLPKPPAQGFEVTNNNNNGRHSSTAARLRRHVRNTFVRRNGARQRQRPGPTQDGKPRTVWWSRWPFGRSIAPLREGSRFTAPAPS